MGTSFLSRLDNPNVTDFVLIEVAADIWGKLENRVVLLTAPDTLDPYGSAYQALTAQKAIHLGGLFWDRHIRSPYRLKRVIMCLYH